MHRFYLPPDLCHAETLVLTGREAHHALHVLRIRTGESVTVLDGEGGVFLCEVRGVAGHHLQLGVRGRQSAAPLPYRITLLQSIPRGKLFDAIVQKATELGAARVVPLLAERGVSRPDPGVAGAKSDKWRQVAIEAIKQCGSPWLPRIEPPVSPAQFIARGENIELSLVAALEGDRRPPRDCFEEFLEQNRRMPSSVAVWIGPEGDFTPAELERIKAAGAKPISLGPLVLRTETAATYCLSILNYELSANSP
jgi:16S rRNA (uracil1498-N3)-methyltransferase